MTDDRWIELFLDAKTAEQGLAQNSQLAYLRDVTFYVDMTSAAGVGGAVEATFKPVHAPDDQWLLDRPRLDEPHGKHRHGRRRVVPGQRDRAGCRLGAAARDRQHANDADAHGQAAGREPLQPAQALFR